MIEHQLETKLYAIQEQLQKQIFDKKEILDFKKADHLLCIAKSTLYSLTQKRSILFRKHADKIILFKGQELMAWINGREMYTNQIKTNHEY